MKKYYLSKVKKIEEKDTFKTFQELQEYLALKKAARKPDFDSSEMQEAQSLEAQAGEFDYRLEGDGFAGLQIRGERDYQEDRTIQETLTADENKQFRSLSKEKQEVFLIDCFETLNRAILNPDENICFQGSTGVIAIVDPQLNKFHVANLGDSEVIRVRCTEEDAEAKTVNILHNPVGEEAERVKAIPGNNLSFARIAGDLAVSRAFGDAQYAPFGLIGAPDIYSVEKVVSGNEEAFIIVASDGLKEGTLKGLQNSEIAYLVHQHRKQSLAHLATILTHTAINKGSSDNISILMFKFPCKELDSIVVLGVFDGHGGAEVSEYLRTNFMQVFRAKLKHSAEEDSDLCDDIARLTIPRTLTPSFDYASSSSSSSSANESVAEKEKITVKMKI